MNLSVVAGLELGCGSPRRGNTQKKKHPTMACKIKVSECNRSLSLEAVWTGDCHLAGSAFRAWIHAVKATEISSEVVYQRHAYTS